MEKEKNNWKINNNMDTTSENGLGDEDKTVGKKLPKRKRKPAPVQDESFDEPIIRVKNPKKFDHNRLCDCINSNLIEYMNSYILIGYDTAGEEVVIINMQSVLEERALKDLVGEVVHNTMFGE